LNKFYDEVIPHVRDAEAVMIFGPGEAKFEFQKRLSLAHPNVNISAVETLDKTDRSSIRCQSARTFAGSGV